MRKRPGFTLIELLISVILMVILISAVTLIFVRTTETVNIAEARQMVYTNGRFAIDTLENDLLGCLKFESGYNRFIMENGRRSSPGSPPAYGVTGGHDEQACDRITFRTTTVIGDALQTCEITYELIPGNQALDAAGTAVAGDNTYRSTARTTRPMYTLVRRVRVPAPGTVDLTAPWTEQPKDRDGNVVPDTEICRFVLSFNLEYLGTTQADGHEKNMTFSQLEPSYFTPSDPLGDGLGLNDTPGGTIPDPNGGPDVPTPLRVPAVRVTLVIIEDFAERQERVFQKVMLLPMG